MPAVLRRTAGFDGRRIDDDVDLLRELLAGQNGVLDGNLLAIAKRIGPSVRTVVRKARLRKPMDNLVSTFLRLMQQEQFLGGIDGADRSKEPQTSLSTWLEIGQSGTLARDRICGSREMSFDDSHRHAFCLSVTL